jgi:hypothetical protein
MLGEPKIRRPSLGASLWDRQNYRVALVFAIGVVFFFVGFVLLLNVFAAGDYVIRHLTSRSLGQLAPGFAATKRGMRTYATLLLAIGVVCLGLGGITRNVVIVAALLVLGAMTFGVASVVAIAGEIETYRDLRKPRQR